MGRRCPTVFASPVRGSLLSFGEGELALKLEVLVHCGTELLHFAVLVHRQFLVLRRLLDPHDRS